MTFRIAIEPMATVGIVSLSIAAIAVLIFGVAMDTEAQEQQALCGGRR
jgi:hypothetical protein